MPALHVPITLRADDAATPVAAVDAVLETLGTGYSGAGTPPAAVLTVMEVARALRCSKAHVHHLIAGTVRGVRPLPSLWLGRRRLILRASFNAWMSANEHHA